jgi:hypothetical protein
MEWRIILMLTLLELEDLATRTWLLQPKLSKQDRGYAAENPSKGLG